MVWYGHSWSVDREYVGIEWWKYRGHFVAIILTVLPFLFSLSFLIWWYWELNPGPFTCEASILPLKLHPLVFSFVFNLYFETGSELLRPASNL